MPENGTEKNINIVVVKRDGKKADFKGEKIAVAIKKGFDSIEVIFGGRQRNKK